MFFQHLIVYFATFTMLQFYVLRLIQRNQV